MFITQDRCEVLDSESMEKKGTNLFRFSKVDQMKRFYNKPYGAANELHNRWPFWSSCK